MFASTSRYRTAADLAAPDPYRVATFRHLVTQNDRLDEVATRYYGRPPLWWQICDANPELLSPLDLLGGGPVQVTRIPLALTPAGPPPWAQLARALLAVTGVEAVRIEDDVELVPEPRQQDGRSVVVVLERPVRAVVVTHSPVVATVPGLLDAVRSTAFAPGPAVEVERIGQEILIPPLAIG
jgi:hypothetical protein